MAHFAEIDENNIVLRVCVVDDAYEADGENWCKNFWGGTWKQTSYNNRIRYNFAGIGFTYDSIADAFIPQKPYSSWILDENYQWKAPKEYPGTLGDRKYYWDESSKDWVKRDSDLLDDVLKSL